MKEDDFGFELPEQFINAAKKEDKTNPTERTCSVDNPECETCSG